MPEQRQQFQKSAMDATTVTLVPSVVNPDHMAHESPIVSLVVTFAGAPPADWGAVGDGKELMSLFRVVG